MLSQGLTYTKGSERTR